MTTSLPPQPKQRPRWGSARNLVERHKLEIKSRIETGQSLIMIYEELKFHEHVAYRGFCRCVQRMMAKDAALNRPSIQKETTPHDRDDNTRNAGIPKEGRPLNFKSFQHNKKPRSSIQAALRRADDKTDG